MPGGTEVSVDARDMERTLERAGGNAKRAVRSFLLQAGQLGRSEMVEFVKGKFKNPKGPLAASIRYVITGDEARISPNVPYAAFVNDGTRPHVIRAKNARALAIPRAGGQIVFRQGRAPEGGVGPRQRLAKTRFKYGGKSTTTGVIFRQSVQHPGTTGYHYAEHTASELERRLPSLLEAVVAREVERA